MGKWDRRYFPRRNRRNRYQDSNWSPPRESYPDPEFTVWEDNVPLWEKKFCYQSGVPWERVLTRKTCNEWYTSVLDWDDLAGKEAFHQAKAIYWAKINNLPCDYHMPGPDLYLAEIDWNSQIDPELIRDLDRAFFLPDEDDTRSGDQGTNPKLVPASSSGWEDIKKTIDNDCKASKWDPWANDNPWEHGQTSGSMKDKPTKWDRWDDDRDGGAKNNDIRWNKASGWDHGCDGGAKDPWIKASGWGDGWDGGVKKAYNNDNSWNKPTGWGAAWDGAERPANSDKPWGKATAGGTWNDGWDGGAHKPANYCGQSHHNSWGNNGWAKGHESKPQNLSGTVKVSSHINNNRSWRQSGNEWADSRVGQWEHSTHFEPENNRSSYHASSNSRYQHGPVHKGASKEGSYSGGQKRWQRHDNSNMRWSQKGQGETYGGPRKREGSSQYWDGHRGSRLRYVDQTSQRYEGWS